MAKVVLKLSPILYRHVFETTITVCLLVETDLSRLLISTLSVSDTKKRIGSANDWNSGAA